MEQAGFVRASVETLAVDTELKGVGLRQQVECQLAQAGDVLVAVATPQTGNHVVKGIFAFPSPFKTRLSETLTAIAIACQSF